MQIRQLFTCVSLGLILLSTTACEDYFGDKTDLDFIDIPDFTNRQVAYVPILPVLDNFERPSDICIGFDELIYVVDEANEAVIALDEAGREIGRVTVPGARSVTQDRRFDLLVIGSFDTTITINGVVNNLTFSAIYRLDLQANGDYGIKNAEIVNKIVHPFFEKNSFSSSDQQVTFNRIGVLADNFSTVRNNQYYVSRSGPGGGPFGPSDAVFWFDNNDELITRVVVNTSGGSQLNDYFQNPNGLTTLAQPPQITASSSRDFLYTSLDPANALKVQYIEFAESENGAEWRPNILASDDTSKASGFINSPNKFRQPYDVTVAGDASSFIFVVDAELDSLYQFTLTGLEGVLPPAATGITKYQKASFGGTGTGVTQFNNPQAVAYFNDILYVADTDNGRVLRFKLTLDFD
jgi:hypothetical protein